ncbi:MAG: TolB family protein, partial [Thermoanaerobaculia bacterium]
MQLAVNYHAVRMHRTILLLVFVAVSSVARAQGPTEEWRTITTAHFRVHYPVRYAAWAERVASTIESVREAVVNEVGFAPPQITDVLIGNPLAVSNGSTLPLLDTPRLVLWAEPPPPESEIGEYTTWIDLLSVHEMAHLVHLLRPSRNPMVRHIERLLLPLNPITLAAPQWVLEGYATVVEGRLTGSGRPPSAIRAAILRDWAATGQFPSYSQLNSNRGFLGGSMRYLAGSAFLEWLEARSGRGSLRDLWARMTARQRRSFDTAFEGVFGDPPRKLYGEFVAAVTADAVAVKHAREPLQEGALWQQTRDNSGDPAVSPDGSKIAIVLRSRTAPSKIVIWATGAASKEQRKYEERIAKLIARDPFDVAPRNPKPLPRKPLHTYTAPDGRAISSPRWLRDGSILFSRRQPDREGFLHHDLFLWSPDSGKATRVTHLADVFDADPLPDDRSAVAVRSRGGATQLVRVDLASGSVAELTPPSIETVYSHPRAGADGSIVASVHRGGEWHVDVFDRSGGLLREVTTNAASPEWSGSDVIATVSRDGFIDLHRFGVAGDTPLTRMNGAAFDPAPSPDGRVFFMSLTPEGFALRVVAGADGLKPVATPMLEASADSGVAT